MKSFKEWFKNLPSGKKNAFVGIGAGLALLTVTLMVLWLSTPAEKPVRKAVSGKKRELSTPIKMLQETALQESRMEAKRRNEQISGMNRKYDAQLNKQQKELERLQSELENLSATKKSDKRSSRQQKNKSAYPPPPQPGQGILGTNQTFVEAQPSAVGGISIFKNPDAQKLLEANSGKKKENGLYLPSGTFMRAYMLTGIAAPTIQGAKNDPAPLHMRVTGKAMLPNKTEVDLRGCFLQAEGYGSLADERAHMRLLTISCAREDGLIDENITGYLVDQDGILGLSGLPISKMDKTLSRAIMAGIFSGFGDYLRQSALTTAISPLGTTYTLDTEKLATAGVGSGLATGFDELERYYMDLARQAVPVIWVGAGKVVDVVVKKGLKLKIQKQCNEVGGDRCE